MLNSLLELEICYLLNDILICSEIWFVECKELYVKFGLFVLIKL